MKLNKLLAKSSALLLVGATALGVGTPVHAKTITYKNCVVGAVKQNNCFQNSNKPSTDCPEVEGPSTDCPEVHGPSTDCPDVEKPETPNKPEKPNKPNKPEKPETPNKPEKPETNETPDVETPEINEGSQAAYENKVLELVNVERAKQGLGALKMDESVRKVARLKSEDMRKNNYFDHTSPTYGSPFDMLKKFGVSYRSAGENIAQGYQTPEQVVKGWMNSPGHRANILNESFTHLGVGYDSNGHYWTQMFIGK